MKTIIAGSRWIEDFDIVKRAIEESGFGDDITEVVSGAAKGVDTLGENWAALHDLPVKRFKADWKNLKTKPLVIRQNSYGTYNAMAGLVRNTKMANYADALIAVWDEASTGTAHMIREAKEQELVVFVFSVEYE